MNKGLIALLVVAALALPLYFFWPDIQTVTGNTEANASTATGPGKEKDKDKKSRKDKKNKGENEASPGISVLEKWELPDILTEVSGITWIGQDEMACIQDEAGTIFIYNTNSGKIEKEIPFGSSGDYEGIALVGDNAYVVRADGILFEVINYRSGKPTTRQYTTGLTSKQDVEGLCYDAKNNRLLLAIKGEDANGTDSKGIYAFDLATKKMSPNSVYRIDLNHEIFNEVNEKKKADVMRPSGIAVHPKTGELFIIEGANPKLLILDSGGIPKKLYKLSSADFPQPEGITFSPSGDLFISSEGKDGAGSISQVSIAH